MPPPRRLVDRDLRTVPRCVPLVRRSRCRSARRAAGERTKLTPAAPRTLAPATARPRTVQSSTVTLPPRATETPDQRGLDAGTYERRCARPSRRRRRRRRRAPPCTPRSGRGRPLRTRCRRRRRRRCGSARRAGRRRRAPRRRPWLWSATVQSSSVPPPPRSKMTPESRLSRMTQPTRLGVAPDWMSAPERPWPKMVQSHELAARVGVREEAVAAAVAHDAAHQRRGRAFAQLDAGERVAPHLALLERAACRRRAT